MRTLPSQCVGGFEDRVIGPVTPLLHSVEETAFSFCHYTKKRNTFGEEGYCVTAQLYSR